jgi:hypothetical protein
MFRALRWAAVIVIVAFAGAQAVRPARTNPPSPAGASLLAKAPPDVARILERACRDCHSNDTRWPWYSNIAPASWLLVDHVNHGREHFNYSEWATYDEDEQDKVLGSICSLTRKGRMPLPSYLLIHRDARLAAPDVTALCRWSDKMRDTLQ